MEPFRLPDLPIEITLRILEFTVVCSSKSNPIDIEVAIRRSFHSDWDSIWPNLKEGADRLSQPAVTRTCRLLRNEGLRIFYSQNCFLHHAIYRSSLSFWLNQLSHDLRPHITVFCKLLKPSTSTGVAAVWLDACVKCYLKGVEGMKTGVDKDSGKILMQKISDKWCCRLAFRESSGMALLSIEEGHEAMLKHVKDDKEPQWALVE